MAVPDQGGADLEAGVLVVKDDAGVALLGRGAVGVDKGNAALRGKVGDAAVMVADIDHALDLLGGKVAQRFLKKSHMLGRIGQVVVVAFEQTHVGQDNLEAVFLAIGLNAVDDLGRVEHGEILGDDPDGVGTAQLQIFGEHVGLIFQTRGSIEDLLGFFRACRSGFAVENVGDGCHGDAGHAGDIFDGSHAVTSGSKSF